MLTLAARVLALLALLLAPVSAAHAAGNEDFSPAQLALFGTPHLDNLAGPTQLRYDLVRKGSREPAFEDTVAVTVTAVEADGSKDLAFDFLSGDRRRDFNDIEGFRGNPLVMLFLQWDVEVMAQVLAGNQHYFRNRIRNSLVEGAEVEEASVEIDGQSVSARRVTFQPFVGDPNAERMGAFEQKLYEFVLSADVPGGIYSIRTFVPGENGAEPEIEDSLTFRETAD